MQYNRLIKYRKGECNINKKINNNGSGGEPWNNFILAGTNIITLEGFCQTILAVMRKAYPDCRVELHDRIRNNGVHGKSLSIDNGFCSSSPEIPLDKFYRDYIGGQHLLAVCQAIAAYYEECRSYNDLKDYKQVEPMLCHGLINTEKNKAMLENTPHVRFLDLSIIFYIPVRVLKDRMDRIVISKSMMEDWGITDHPEDLYKAACKNTGNLFPGRVISAEEIQREAVLNRDEIDPDILKEVLSLYAVPDARPLYAATNDKYLYGAAVILYDKLLKSFADEIKDDLVILPSSVHECMLVPLSCANLAQLKEMVVSMNRKMDEEDVLSDNIYLYNRATDQIGIIGDGEKGEA